MKAGIYLRQSKYHDGSISMDDQEHICREMCAREGWEVVGVWRDDNTPGGSVTKRDGLRGLRKAYSDGKIEIAVAREISRFARNMKDGADIVGDMRLASVMEGVQPEDDDFVPLLHFLLAHKQRTEIGKRWKQVHAYRVRHGLTATGKARFGYVRDGQGYAPDPVTGPILAELYRRYTAGEGWLTLVKDLNARGLTSTSGDVWRVSTLRKVCDSGFGAGFIRVKGELLAGAHKAVITPAEWRAYQAVRQERATLPARSQTVVWHLAGIACCGLCGSGLVTARHTPRVQVRCGNAARTGQCEGVYIVRPDLDAAVALWLGGHVEEWAAVMPDDSEERRDAEAALGEAERAVESLDAQAGRLTRLLASEALDEAGYRLAIEGINAERVTAQAAVSAAGARLAHLLPEDADVYERLTGTREVAVGEWNGLLKRVIDRVEVHKDRLVVVPRRGGPTTLPRPTRRQVQTRTADGKFGGLA